MMIALAVLALLTLNWDLILVSGTDKTPAEFVTYINGLGSPPGNCSDGDFKVDVCESQNSPGDNWAAMCAACAKTKCEGDYKTASREDFTQCCTDCNTDSNLDDNSAKQGCCTNCPETIVATKTNVVDFVSYIDVNLIQKECNIDKSACTEVHTGNPDWTSMCGTLDQTSCTAEDEHVTPEQLKECCTECDKDTTCCAACPDTILAAITTSETEKTTTTASSENSTDFSAPLVPLNATWVIAITTLIAYFL